MIEKEEVIKYVEKAWSVAFLISVCSFAYIFLVVLRTTVDGKKSASKNGPLDYFRKMTVGHFSKTTRIRIIFQKMAD